MSPLSTRRNIILNSLYSTGSLIRSLAGSCPAMTNSNVHFVWKFRFSSLTIRFSNPTTFHYAVDVRQPTQRSTPATPPPPTTTTMSSPDINIGFYTFWICVLCRISHVCQPNIVGQQTDGASVPCAAMCNKFSRFVCRCC